MAEKSAEDIDKETQKPTSPEVSPSTSNKENEDSSGWGNWGSWYNTAKSKSAEVFTMVKKDLDELGTAVKSEASHVMCTTSNVIGKTLKLDEPESTASTVKRSFSLFIDQMSTALNPLPEDDEAEAVLITGGDTPTLVSYQRELEALQRVDATYLVPGSGPEFDAWCSARSEGDINPAAVKRRLDQSPLLRSQHAKLVPDPVSEEDFWERYLFRLALLQDRVANSARRKSAPPAVSLPAEKKSSTPSSESSDPVVSHITGDDDDNDDGFIESADDSPVSPPKPLKKNPSWEDEDFLSDMELSEEQQIKLLQEYEAEMKSTKKGKTAKDDSTESSTNSEDAKKPAEPIVSAPKKAGTGGKKTAKKAASLAKEKTAAGDLVEDHFDSKKTVKTKKGKKERNANDDTSSNSDESWEKEFEIEDDTADK